MSTHLALTIIAEDRPGIVEKIAEAVRKAGGNWLESNLSRLAGKFAGVLLVSIPADAKATLEDALARLEGDGIRVLVETASTEDGDHGQQMRINLVANDRPGIVEELSKLFSANRVNVEELTTECESAPMSAEPLFRANAVIRLPVHLGIEDIVRLLESLSDDLVVEIDD